MLPSLHERFELAIVCALPREFDAAEAIFDEHYSDLPIEKHHADSNFYRTGKIGSIGVVLACMPEMGKASAATATANLRSNFPNIRLALVVGICGGVPFPNESTEIILGDVIISHKVLRFDFGRQYPDGFEPKGSAQETLDRSDGTIRSLLTGLQTQRQRDQFQEMHMRHLEILQKQEPRWKYPGINQDQLFSSCCHDRDHDCREECSREPVSRKRLATDNEPKPRLHFGSLASGDTVMKSARHRDKLSSKTQIIGFEMEGAGVCDSLSCLIIKGVCDYADYHKNKEWQDYAAAAATSCTRALLELYECKSLVGRKAPRPCVGGSIVANTTCDIVSVSSCAKTPTYGADQNIQSIDEELRSMGEQIPDPVIRHLVISAARNAIQGSKTRTHGVEKARSLESKSLKTPFGTIDFQNLFSAQQLTLGSETTHHGKTRITIVFRPAPWILRLGFHYGLIFMATNRDRSWQYTILPVQPVPDDSLIFEFCAKGTLDGVRTLFARGQASVRDVNTNGKNPLHFAMSGHNLEVAKFLILQGADKRASTYQTYSPLFFLQDRHFGKTTFELLSLFKDGIEFCDIAADGWFLLALLNNWDPKDNFASQNIHAWLSFLLAIFWTETTVIVNDYLVMFVLFMASSRKDLDNIKMILNFDPKKENFTYLLSDPDAQLYLMKDVKCCFLALQFFIDSGIDFQPTLGRETPISRLLRFSTDFFNCTGDIRLLASDANSVFQREISERRAPSLQGWFSDTLGDLFLLSLSHWAHIEHQYAVNLKLPRQCLGCGLIEKPPTFETWKQLIIEPWWEELKHSIKARKCICINGELVYDSRDPSRFIHDGCDMDTASPNAGNKTDDLHHASIDCRAESDPQDDTNSNDGYQTAEEIVDGPSDDEDTSKEGLCGCPRCQPDFVSFGLLIEHYYESSGGWLYYYEPREFYCFYCLAEMEQWDIERCCHDSEESMDDGSDSSLSS
ncbi:hypothetical protein BJX99DRAFT_256387 [Aspergillus californicus]